MGDVVIIESWLKYLPCLVVKTVKVMTNRGIASLMIPLIVYDLIFVGPLDFENSAPPLKQILRA